jgi:hypothetical protein
MSAASTPEGGRVAARFLHNNAVPVLIDTEYTLASNKVVLIDGQIVTYDARPCPPQ